MKILTDFTESKIREFAEDALNIDELFVITGGDGDGVDEDQTVADPPPPPGGIDPK